MAINGTEVPVFSGLNNVATFTEGGGRIFLDTDATIADADAGAFEGATLSVSRRGGGNADDAFSIAAGLIEEDGEIRFVNVSGMQVTFGRVSKPGDGTLSVTFNDQATEELVNTVLQGLSYGNSNENPSGSVIIDYSFDNGDVATGSVTVNLVATNDSPDLEGVTAAIYFTPGEGPQAIGSQVTIYDGDSATLASAKLEIDGVSPDDQLAAVTTGTNITASFAGGKLTLSGTDTLANYQQVLSSVTYESLALDPTVGGTVFDKTIYWTLDDGSADNGDSLRESTRVTFTPSIDADGSAAGRVYATSFTENGSGTHIVDADVAVSGGSYGLNAATIVVADARSGDSLEIGALPLGILATVDTSIAGRITVSLTGSASAASYEQALRAIQFSSTSDDPGQTRTVEISVGDGMSTSTSATTTIAITEMNDAPVLAQAITDQTLQLGQSVSFSLPAGTFTDVDNAVLNMSATLEGGAALPSWLQFNAATGHFTGTPTSTGAISITVSATDGSLTVSDTFKITTTPAPVTPNPPPVNTEPMVATPNVDTSIQAGSSVVLNVGDGRFSDPEGNDLTYSITVNGAALPSWITFDAETGQLTATPRAGDTGSFVITVTASDGLLTMTDEFVLDVSGPLAPEDPTGTKGDDKIVGDDFDNILDGRKGNDRLTGGDGADTFVLGRHYGRDVITDFDPGEGDRIDLSAAHGIRNFRDLIRNHAVDTGDNVRISAADGSVLVIRNIDLEDLSRDMFLF